VLDLSDLPFPPPPPPTFFFQLVEALFRKFPHLAPAILFLVRIKQSRPWCIRKFLASWLPANSALLLGSCFFPLPPPLFYPLSRMPIFTDQVADFRPKGPRLRQPFFRRSRPSPLSLFLRDFSEKTASLQINDAVSSNPTV